jgi:putrescine transport system ATP-binding protein
MDPRPDRPMIRFDRVSKRFGTQAAISDIDLEIAAGEFFALLGPSGSGKTTLMRLLAGFETPDTGRILLDGEDLTALPPHRRPVNMMFQSYALFPHMSVAANVGYGLKMEGFPRTEIAARVEEMLALVRLEGFEARRPGQLSGGERQRVALARALARRPRVLLLDEPLAALDRRLREETQGQLKAIQARLGTTFLVVTHDQDEAMALADRLAILREGRIAQVGTPRALYDQPLDRYVAAFLGDVNLFPAQLVGVDGQWARVAIDEYAQIRISGRPDVSPGDQVWVAVRPERLQLAEAKATRLQGVIEDVGYLGDHTVWRIATGGGRILKATTANIEGAPVFGVGEVVSVHFDPGSARLLPC